MRPAKGASPAGGNPARKENNGLSSLQEGNYHYEVKRYLLLKPNNEFVSGKLKGTKMFDRYIKLLLPQKKLFA